MREVPAPHAGPGEVRVRVAAAGLNPMDWDIASRPEAAERFGITVPSGFGSDFAGVVDEVDGGVTGVAVGDRVYGGALGRAVADFVVVKAPSEALWHTAEGISDEVASTLPVAGLTAAAAVAAIDLRPGDTVLVGGAAGGVGVFAVQLAKLAGAKVIGTASESTFEFLRQFGAEPVAYGPGLVDRVQTLAPEDVTAATDLFGTETAETALTLGVPPERISTIAPRPHPPGDNGRVVGGAHPRAGRLQLHPASLPLGMEHRLVGLNLYRSEAVDAAHVMRAVHRMAAPAWIGRPVPIIESRVTIAASWSSLQSSVEAGRIGTTR